ncbi:MAG: SRPBCC domain-containing protein [Acidimicrobiales bacterium]
MNETKATVADDVATSVRISAPPDAVFDYLVEPAKLMTWMGLEARIDPRPGGRFWLNITGNDRASGQYLEVDRPRRVSFTWGWEGSEEVPPGSSTVTIDLTVEGDETLVELTHSGLPEALTDRHADGWVHYLSRLATAATGGDPGPDSNASPRDQETG